MLFHTSVLKASILYQNWCWTQFGPRSQRRWRSTPGAATGDTTWYLVGNPGESNHLLILLSRVVIQVGYIWININTKHIYWIYQLQAAVFFSYFSNVLTQMQGTFHPLASAWNQLIWSADESSTNFGPPWASRHYFAWRNAIGSL